MNLFMPGVVRNSEDEYVCSTFPISREHSDSYIISYEPSATKSTAHHIILYGCESSSSSQPYYSCGSICDDGKEKIIFAWGNNANKFEYPSDTGMAVGRKAGINAFVLQVHYLKASQVKDYSGFLLTLTDDPPKFSVGIFLMFSYYGEIEPKKRKVHLDVSCSYQGKSEAYTLAFRTHTHTLGRSVTGFRVAADGQIKLIGKGNPQWPQTFYKASKVFIKPGDILMSRCLFDSTSRDRLTRIGSTHHDEMCNFYIMVVTKNNGENNFLTCGGDEYKDLWKNIPSYSMEYDAPNPSPDLFLVNNAFSNQDPIFKMVKADENWKVNYQLGEVSGLTILRNGSPDVDYTLIVLHRGSHKWSERTFRNNVYQDSSNPISAHAILEVDPISGKVLRQAGQNLFFMPHGITVTKDGKHIWITDVALHQVMRFNLRNDAQLIDGTPSIVLGEKFVPGNDRNHFCKPAKVAVDKQGNIFVADGYCNQRVVCFSANGTFIDEWLIKDAMYIVHSITIQEDISGDIMKNVVWVADRENRRIIGFNYDGSFKSVLYSNFPIYAIEYNPFDQLMYGISSNGEDTGYSFTFNMSTFLPAKSWNANFHLRSPHDLCLAENGSTIFVAELHLKKVIKFHRKDQLSTNGFVVNANFDQIPDIVKNINPFVIVFVLISLVVVLVACIVLMKCYRRQRFSKTRRYGPSFKDKEGFRPLKQSDDGHDDNDSDPEAEEYSIPHGYAVKKEKA